VRHAHVVLLGRQAHLLARLDAAPCARELSAQPGVRGLADADDRVSLLAQDHAGER
jgi:hypothetical protein